MITVLSNKVLEGKHQKPIVCDVFFKASHQLKPIVVFVHGFKGMKDWGHFNALARHFAEQGFIFIKFNFSHNGTTPKQPDVFADLEAFGNNNYGIELDDLQTVIDWSLSCEELAAQRIEEHVSLIGHSRGGGISILKAGEDGRVKKLVTWGSVSGFIDRNKQRTIESWKKDGVVYTSNARTKQKMPLYFQFYEDLIKNAKRYNVIQSIHKLNIPILIVHGTADEAVPVQEAHQLRTAAQHAELILVEGSGHTFEVRHPFEGGSFPPNAELVIFKTVEFLRS
jgi:pimeloyl-ACP methyl ester carboxylesterase